MQDISIVAAGNLQPATASIPSHPDILFVFLKMRRNRLENGIAEFNEQHLFDKSEVNGEAYFAYRLWRGEMLHLFSLRINCKFGNERITVMVVNHSL